MPPLRPEELASPNCIAHVPRVLVSTPRGNELVDLPAFADCDLLIVDFTLTDINPSDA